MESIISAFIAGIAAGIALHRLIMAIVLDKALDNACAYCEWLERKKNQCDVCSYGRKQEKNRHK